MSRLVLVLFFIFAQVAEAGDRFETSSERPGENDVIVYRGYQENELPKIRRQIAEEISNYLKRDSVEMWINVIPGVGTTIERESYVMFLIDPKVDERAYRYIFAVPSYPLPSPHLYLPTDRLDGTRHYLPISEALTAQFADKGTSAWSKKRGRWSYSVDNILIISVPHTSYVPQNYRHLFGGKERLYSRGLVLTDGTSQIAALGWHQMGVLKIDLLFMSLENEAVKATQKRRKAAKEVPFAGG